MGFSISATKFGGVTGAGSTTTGAISVTIAAAAAVAIMCNAASPGATPTGNGSVTDNASSSNTYTATAAGVATAANWTEAFYCLNTTNSATTFTYTPPTVTGGYSSIYCVAYVLTVTGGTAAFPTPNGYRENHQFPTTATDNVTVGGTIAVSGAGAIIMGVSTDQGTTAQDYTAGTNYTSDGTDGTIHATMWEHQFVSAATAVTWTTSDASANTWSQALGFNLAATDVLLPQIQL